MIYNQKRPTVSVNEYDPSDEELPDYLLEVSPGYIFNVGYDWNQPHQICDLPWGQHMRVAGTGEIVCPHQLVGKFSSGEVRVISLEELEREWSPSEAAR